MYKALRLGWAAALRPAEGGAESGSQCGTAGTGNGTDDDSDTKVDDGCPSTKHAYDNLDRLLSVTDALGRVTSYQYDAASNLTQRTDARNLVTKYFPDDVNRLDLIEHWNGMTLVDSVDYAYNSVGFRTQMADPTGTTTYTPDALDRVTSVTFPGPKTVNYQYDDLPGGSVADYPGQRTKITYPDITKYAEYTYEADGRMKTVTDWQIKQTVYTYDDAGRLTKTQYPNTVWTDFTYDAASRLFSVANKKTGPVTISSFTYTLDSAGNRAQMVDLSGTHLYQYDALYRLTLATYPGPQSDTYTYDANGNRLTKNATSYAYDAADQMTAAGGVSYGYDNNGDQTSRGSDTFTYDHENRLTLAVIAGSTSSSIYNGDGLRMSHTVGAQTTTYTWDSNGSLPMVLQDGTNTYVYGLDLISATDGAGVQTYLLYDGLGSTTGLTDGTGNNPVSYSYDIFGSIRTQSGPSNNFWLFTGEQNDSDSSLYYLRARYYDPSIGRFLTRDPFPGVMQKPQTQHPYAYALNSPCNFTDPSGLVSEGTWGAQICTISAVVEGFFRQPYDGWEVCLPFVGCLGEVNPFFWDWLFSAELTIRFDNTPRGAQATVLDYSVNANEFVLWQETDDVSVGVAGGSANLSASFDERLGVAGSLTILAGITESGEVYGIPLYDLGGPTGETGTDADLTIECSPVLPGGGGGGGTW